MNFEQSSYEVMEDGYEVFIGIVLSQPSSEPFEVMISLMNVTNGECNNKSNYFINIFSYI